MARFFIALVIGIALICVPQAKAELFNPLDGLIRLQVVARSDSKEDQLEKLQVRDRVRALAAEVVRGASDSDEAYRRLEKARDRIARVSDGRVEIREVDCPVRVYGRIVVPAGRYRAVRVILGEGKGRNWWCVLYPDLCGVDTGDVKALTGGQPVVFYSEIMRWIEAPKGDVQ